MSHVFRTTFLAGLALSVFGCKPTTYTERSQEGGTLDATAASTTGFLKLSDFDSEAFKLQSLSSFALHAAISSRNEFFNHRQKASGALQLLADSNCANDLLYKAPVQIRGNVFAVSVEKDIKDCVKDLILGTAPSSDAEVEIETASFRVLFRNECQGVDLSRYSGKTFADAKDFDSAVECEKSNFITFLAQYDLSFKGVAKAKGESIRFDSVSRTAVMQEDGKPCKATRQDDTWSVSAGCTQAFLKTDIKPHSGTRFIAKQKGIKAKALLDSFYSDGSMEFELNDWSGTMKYSGAFVAPSWTAKSKSNDPETSGVFGVSNPDTSPKPAASATPSPTSTSTPVATPTPTATPTPM